MYGACLTHAGTLTGRGRVADGPPEDTAAGKGPIEGG